MKFRVVKLVDVPPTPWANGTGATRELLAWPAPDLWSVRLSVAEVTQAGPFSSLPRVRRWFCVLEGEGVVLRVGGMPPCELTRLSAPFEFDGAAQTECELLGGPTRDFNLMLRRGQAKIARFAGTHQCTCERDVLVAVYAREGAQLQCGAEELTITPDALAWRILDSRAPIRVIGGDTIWMEIER